MLFLQLKQARRSVLARQVHGESAWHAHQGQRVALDSIDGAALADYAAITGHLLAKGHARTSGASMIVGYAGSSDHLDVALARFARRPWEDLVVHTPTRGGGPAASALACR